MSRPSLLLVEPYYGGSHKVWADGLARHLDRDVDLVTLPARWWKWRMRGAAVTLAQRCRQLDHRPDAVLVGDMIDLAAFRGLLNWPDVPVAIYFHESQFSYPDSPQMAPDEHYAYTNWQSAVAADRVFFNSRFHLESFLARLPGFLRRFPDENHGELIDGVAAKSEVLEVGLDLEWTIERPSMTDGPATFLWNHRWEHDKNPSAFFEAVDKLSETGLDFALSVTGENFRNRPSEFQSIRRQHRARIRHFGHLPVGEYREAVLGADVVVSTSLQEFFGVSVVEAAAAGCFPLLPNRLSYPELVPLGFHSNCLYGDGQLGSRMAEIAGDPDRFRAIGQAVAPSMRRFDWGVMAPRYEEALNRLERVPRG